MLLHLGNIKIRISEGRIVMECEFGKCCNPKPQMKRKVGLDDVVKCFREILFYTDVATAVIFCEFGNVDLYKNKNQYLLTVDARFDFDEVLAYMKAFS